MKKTPLRRAAPRKRRDGQPMCIARKCRRARFEDQLCTEHFADRLWADAIKARDERCQGVRYFPDVACGGRMEADHLIPREYHGTRWNLSVGVTLCNAHHMHVTGHRLEHDELARQVMGAEHYDAMRFLAMKHIPERPEDAIARLREVA